MRCSRFRDFLAAPDDVSLFRVIRDGGTPGTKMPANPLPPNQLWQLVEFVRSMGRAEGAKSTGDPKRGQQIYASKGGCSNCHSIGGHGGGIGPDLSDIGMRQNAAQVRVSLVDPDASVPLDYLRVRVVTKDGQSITGVRVIEDSFSIQIRDLSNQFHSLENRSYRSSKGTEAIADAELPRYS